MSDAHATCLNCFRSHVKCERSIPCKRCLRLGLNCVPNPRPRGRPKKANSGDDRSVTDPSPGGGGGRPHPAPHPHWAAAAPPAVDGGGSNGGGGGAYHPYHPAVYGASLVAPPHHGYPPPPMVPPPGGAVGAFLEGAGGGGGGIGPMGMYGPGRSFPLPPPPPPPPQQQAEDDDRSLSSYNSGYDCSAPPSVAAAPLPPPPHLHPPPTVAPLHELPGGGSGGGSEPIGLPVYPLEGVPYPPIGGGGLVRTASLNGASGGGSLLPQQLPPPPASAPQQQQPSAPQPQQQEQQQPPPSASSASAAAAAGAGGADRELMKMLGPFVTMLSAGEVAVERTRYLLTSWHLWTLEHGRGGGPQDSSNKDSPPPDDLRELAMLMGLTLPVSYAGWLESRGGAASTAEENDQVQSFLDMCVDDDGSAICSAVYCGGALQVNLNPRFAAMYLTLEELEATVARDKLRPELVWRRLLSPECAGAYDEALCQANFKGQNLGGEACEIVKVVDRFGLEMLCFMRLRIFASSKGAITASVIFLLPLQLSRLVEST